MPNFYVYRPGKGTEKLNVHTGNMDVVIGPVEKSQAGIGAKEEVVFDVSDKKPEVAVEVTSPTKPAPDNLLTIPDPKTSALSNDNAGMRLTRTKKSEVKE